MTIRPFIINIVIIVIVATATVNTTTIIIIIIILTFKGPMTTLVVTESNRQWPNDD
jgi:hypothetical protein